MHNFQIKYRNNTNTLLLLNFMTIKFNALFFGGCKGKSGEDVLPSSVAADWLAALLRIREVPGSNLGP
jgi:hypothetical protein